MFRKEDSIKLDLIHIAKLNSNGTRFFYQKKEFLMPKYVPRSLPGASYINHDGKEDEGLMMKPRLNVRWEIGKSLLCPSF